MWETLGGDYWNLWQRYRLPSGGWLYRFIHFNPYTCRHQVSTWVAPGVTTGADYGTVNIGTIG